VAEVLKAGAWYQRSLKSSSYSYEFRTTILNLPATPKPSIPPPIMPRVGCVADRLPRFTGILLSRAESVLGTCPLPRLNGWRRCVK
jgi:hypothetical protein